MPSAAGSQRCPNLGFAGEADTIRIGKQGTQKATLIAGIYPTAVTGSTLVVNSSGKLGIANYIFCKVLVSRKLEPNYRVE